jgi:hypothetical protein
MNKEIFKQYAALKIKEKEIQEEIETLKPEIMEEIEESGADKIASDFGTFSLISIKKWKFSPAVEEAKKTLDCLQANEKADGTATFEENKQLKYFAPKDNG